MKERVLGIPSLEEGSSGGTAVPFGELARAAELQVAAVRVDSPQGEVLVLWNGNARGAAAFRSWTVEGLEVTITTEGAGFVDQETGTSWSLDGRALEGPLAGERLEPVADAYVAFWFAWEAFQPETDLWGDS